MKSNNKAFTLIELLAIIVILAIIAVITVPIILNIIDNSRKGAATDSAYGFKDAVNKWYVEELSKDHNFMLKSEYTVQDGKIIDANDSNDQGVLIPVSGEKPTSGYLNYTNNVLTAGCLTIGDYAVTFNGNETSTEKGECPEMEYGYKTYDTTKNKETEIIIGTNGYDVTGKKAYLKYALTNGEVLEGTVPEACIYSNTYGGELCLTYGVSNSSLNVGKIKAYFGYNEDTWKKIDDNNMENSSQTITCNFDTSFFHCFDSIVDANSHTDGGYVSASDYSGDVGFTCYNAGADVGCYYES